MRTRLLVIPIILACFLLSCATWKSEMTRAYKGIGALGETYRVTAQTSCIQQLIPEPICLDLKTLNNNARLGWLKAGDVLKIAIQTEDAIKRQELLTEYHLLIAQFNQIFGEFMKVYQKGVTK